ncbi:MAG: hypothetical protein BWK73_08315 [Thiothrix lacustris]|uniref:DUF4332 domain-containing protein n=1 Tax=Thiothrix lacustris TaxID=525917 RepID=A0A1Y1QVK9_9GAMM|nr:MAG: hypothetical protein BWK73_08315 [Thiothrix lacustris]
MNTASTPYTFGMATGEIIALLLLSFVAGLLLCRLLRQMGVCCRMKKKIAPAPKLEVPQLSRPQPVADVYVPKVPKVPIVTMPMHDNLPTHHELPPLPEIDPLLAAIDPHKPIIDLETPAPDNTLETITMHNEPMPTESWKLDPLLANIDPHKPIIDPPDMPETPMKTDPLLDAIDPHKPIIDPPDMPAATDAQTNKDTTLNVLNEWLHKAKEGVEQLTEKATPAANEWLHKAKEGMEQLTEKATPAANEWLHKAKDSVEHLKEKATPVSNDWLHKAKEMTDKLASNLSLKHDDLQKLAGIGPTFSSILHRAGIHTYQQLAETSHQKLQALLIVEDEQFSQHDTSSWPKQAALAAQGDWEQLKAYQDSL